ALLHPFMPFITEEIRSALNMPGLLITSRWPEAGAGADKDASETMETLLRVVDTVRSIRGEYSIPPSQATDLRIACDDTALAERIRAHGDVITSLEKIGTLIADTRMAKPAFSASGLFPGGRIFIPLVGILDPVQEKARLTRDLGKAENFLAVQEKKLANESFVKSAPAEVVEGERLKLQS